MGHYGVDTRDLSEHLAREMGIPLKDVKYLGRGLYKV